MAKRMPFDPAPCALDERDEHKFRTDNEDPHLVCVFNLPMAGEKTRDANGTHSSPI